MNNTMRVKPVAGRLIGDPENNYSSIIKETTVVKNRYWRRAIADGDVELVKDAEVVAAPAPAQTVK